MSGPFSWKDTLPTAAAGALAGALAGMPLKVLELMHKRRQQAAEPSTVINNYYAQPLSDKAAKLLKVAFEWGEVLPSAVGKGLGDLAGKLSGAAVEKAWPKKPKQEPAERKVINNYHIPPEMLAQLAQKRGSFEGERLTAFCVGVDAYCKDAGFDAEDTQAMQKLAHCAFVDKQADFSSFISNGLGQMVGSGMSYLANAKSRAQSHNNPLGAVGEIGRDLFDTSNGVRGWADRANNEVSQWGNVSEDELRSHYQRSYRNYLKQYRPEVAMRMATIESGTDKWEGEMQKDKTQFPELESDYDKWERANAGGNKPAIAGSPPAGATPAAPAAASAPSSPAPAPASPAPAAPAAPKATPPAPPPSATPSLPKAPPAPAVASAPVSTTSSNVPGASTAKPKNPNAGIYVSESGSDKQYMNNFKADGGTIGARGKVTLPPPGFSN